MRRPSFVILLGALIAFAPVGAEDRVVNRPRVPGKLRLHLRERREDKPGSGVFKVAERTAEWEVSETAIIICDMWDDHYCKLAAQRVANMVPKMNRVLTAARDRGVQIIHAPSDTMYLYAGTPHRRRMQQARPIKPPVPIQNLCNRDEKSEPLLPIDTSKCACDDPVVGPYVRRYSRQHPGLDIIGYDGVSDSGEEIYNFCRQEGIKNVVLMGVHTNMCVLARSFGIRQLVRLGMNVALARDLTDALYDPRQPPHVSHARGTEMVIEHIEQYCCPSIASQDLTAVVPESDDPAREKGAPQKPPSPPLRGRGAGGEGEKESSKKHPLTPTPLPRVRGRGASEESPKPEKIPRLPPRQPAEAARSFRTQDGFRMDLLAHEPLVASPVAIAYDENGQAYVLEMRDYPYTDRNNDKAFTESTKDRPLGRVRLLRDRDGDGVFDESVIFADNLSWPTGLACWKGGIFVTATPDLLYLKDSDGDGKADVRQTIFTGFRKFNIQAVINNLQWSLDHHIYGAGGTNGGAIRAPQEAAAPAVTMRANDFRFDPRRPRFELLPGGARFGQSFDDGDHRFLCNIRNPVIHVVLPGHYLARNPFLPVKSALNDAAAAGDTLPVYRASPSEPWRTLRARRWAAEGQNMPRSELVPDGYFTSACGITIYRGAAYPSKYRGNAFLSDVAGNLIHREILTPQGATFTARRAEEKTEFVASTDTWFRPVNFVNAPDGTLHVVDMYRETIEHPWSIPDDIKAQLDLESGRDRGRIWRLTPPGFKPPPPPRLGQASIARLIECLENPNAWWRETAHRLLFERQDRAAVDPLRKLLQTSKSPLARLHALWSLQGLDSLANDDLLCALKDETASVREHAVRLAEPRMAKTVPLVDRIVTLSHDPDVRVRFQVAFSLGEMSGERALGALAAIARRDIEDEWVQLAVLSSTAHRSGALLRLLSEDRPFAATRAGRGLLRRLAQIVGRRQDREETDGVLALLARAADPSTQAEILLGLGEGLSQRGKKLDVVFRGSRSGLTALLGRLLAEARATVADTHADTVRRGQAAELLALGDFAEAREPLTGLLDPRQPSALQLDAVRGLSSFNDPHVSELLLKGWTTYSPPVRAEVVQALLARPQRIGPLLDAIEKRQLSAADVPAARKAVLLRHPDARIRQRATALLGSAAAGPRKEVIARYERALSLPASALRGKLVFQKNCASCHRVGGEGFEVGPSLETVRHHAPSQVLTNILDPNREVSPNYLEYLVTTRDGKTSSGVIVAETVTSLTLKRTGGVQETVLRQNIDDMAGTNRSLMPDGLEQSINVQEMADLLAFLLGKSPSP
jgi:putative membrane-bound dehydrogenase-like protein